MIDVDLHTDEAVDGIEHEPGQVQREGLMQLEDSFESCKRGCLICMTQSWYNTPAGIREVEKRKQRYYGMMQELIDEGYSPVL
jgi:hypothetical protein